VASTSARLSGAVRADGSPIPAIGLLSSRSSRLGIATATVLCLHAGLLLLRPDVSGSSHLAATQAMVVRWLPPPAVAVATPSEPPAEASVAAPRAGERTDAALAASRETRDTPSAAKAAERGALRAASVADSRRPAEPAATGRAVAQPPSEPALAPRPDYLFGARLDPGPRPLDNIEPEYPESAHLQEGKVVLRLLIGETGAVDDVAVVRAEPKGLFEDAALEAFRVARFSPGMVLGRPVKSQITVEVEFLPINRGARISGRMY